ncbi:MAG: VCBS repeat-containing protein [Oscillochloris sp.]|nr:VCBS repeat-containing protein [Oscillochloris sp.]
MMRQHFLIKRRVLVLVGLLAYVGAALLCTGRATGQIGGFQIQDSLQLLGITRSDEVALVDLNGDGNLDAVVQDNEYAPSQIWLNNGNGLLNDGGRIGAQYEGLPLFGDVDGDGDPDAVSRVIRLNDGRGNFSLLRTNDDDFFPLVANRRARTLGDLDGDGDLDYVSETAVWLNDGSGTFRRTTQEFDGAAGALALGDLDGDGDRDLVVLNGVGNELAIWWNNGSAAFVRRSSVGTSNFSSDVVLGDLDGDGNLDALTSGYFGNSLIHWNNGAGEFSRSTVLTNGPRVKQSALGDLDGNGVLDIVMAVEGSDLAWRNLGNQRFELAWSSTQADNSWGVALGDLNADGSLDAVFANMGSFFTPGGGPIGSILTILPGPLRRRHG